MKKALMTLPALLLALALVACPAAMAQQYYGPPPPPGVALFTAGELANLLAPIALYPDPLLAQILPASTFGDQIDEAARFVRMYGVTQAIDFQNWDVSVKAVSHYPEVLFMMDQNADWTAAVGQAFINQETDVMNTIQQLRAAAMSEGNLVSTPQQVVVVQGGIIQILPAVPDTIYVPVYNPQLVYLEPAPPASTFIFFGAGFVIGAWLNRDFDWHRHRIYYHGWQGEGWVGRARPHIHTRGNIYIHPDYSDIHRDRDVMRRDTDRYRERLRDEERYRGAPGEPRDERRREEPRREEKRREEPRRDEPRRDEQRRPQQRAPERPPTVYAPQPARPSPPARVPYFREQDRNREVYRGRDVRQNRPESQTGYGGYGNREDASRYRERGQRSLERMRQEGRPAPQRGTGIVGGQPGQRPAGRGQTAPRQFRH